MGVSVALPQQSLLLSTLSLSVIFSFNDDSHREDGEWTLCGNIEFSWVISLIVKCSSLVLTLGCSLVAEEFIGQP